MIIEWCCEMKRWMNQKGRGTYNDTQYRHGTKTHWRNDRLYSSDCKSLNVQKLAS